MFSNYVLAAVLACPPIVMINRTKMDWTPMDYKNRDHAQIHCREHHPKAPCLKKFSKYDFQSYTAICGRP